MGYYEIRTSDEYQSDHIRLLVRLISLCLTLIGAIFICSYKYRFGLIEKQ